MTSAELERVSRLAWEDDQALAVLVSQLTRRAALSGFLAEAYRREEWTLLERLTSTLEGLRAWLTGVDVAPLYFLMYKPSNWPVEWPSRRLGPSMAELVLGVIRYGPIPLAADKRTQGSLFSELPARAVTKNEANRALDELRSKLRDRRWVPGQSSIRETRKRCFAAGLLHYLDSGQAEAGPALPRLRFPYDIERKDPVGGQA